MFEIMKYWTRFGREDAKMNLTTFLNSRRLYVTLMFFLLIAVLTIYIASERQNIVYYVPDAEFDFTGTADTAMKEPGPVMKNQWDYVSSTQTHSSIGHIPNNDMIKSISKHKNQVKLLSADDSNANRGTEKTKNSGEKKTDFFSNEHYPPEQRERIAKIKRTCSDRELLRKDVFNGYSKTKYYFSSKYNFSYCKVPKSGSTFWTQVFEILKYGAEVSDKVFSKKRSSVHGTMGQYTVKFWNIDRNNSLSILVSRDPFSRLYSAYIDKIYLLLQYKTSVEIRRLKPTGHNRFCSVDVTFQEFLDFIILNARKERTLNRHWAPIYTLCRPCYVNAYILVKQESFSKDVEQALQAFGVEDEKLDVIMSALHDHRVEATIPGIIQTVYSKFGDSVVRNCVDGKNIARRLWTSLKIQGYLKEKLKFPSQLFEYESQYNNETLVTNVILNYINSYKMTSLEMKSQRHKALVDAYSEIKETTIEGIKEVYKIDFEMFDYPTDLPTVDLR